MPQHKLTEGKKVVPDDSSTFWSISEKDFNAFNPSVLGLGEINQQSVAKDAIVAIFDLQDFTNFCKQVDPELSVPTYLSGFLQWLFDKLKSETEYKRKENSVLLYHDLPFCMKFMGDGVLVMWETAGMSQKSQHNLIISCANIVYGYQKTLLPTIRSKVSYAPPRLRCGIAKGRVFSVGNGEDYVGSCINIAARLQKLGGLPIAFSKRGFNPDEYNEDLKTNWVTRKVHIRGVGDDELVCVRKNHLDALHPDEKKLFIVP